MNESDTENPQMEKNEVQIGRNKANKLIKNSIERRVTRSMRKLISKEEVSINAINS